MDADLSLIGRDEPLAAVVAAIRGDRPVVVIGEAGIGKTTLVRAAGAAAGRQIREGGGFATLSWLPYLALRRATGLTETGDPARAAAAVEHAVGPDVLFIDDLQWTDDETREVVSLLVGRIALVAAIRDGDELTNVAMQPLLAHGVEIVRLDGLGEDAAGSLARRLRPDVPQARIDRVVALAGGNPLLIEELIVHGQSSSSLARAIIGQLDTLPANERHALELVALAGRPMPAAVLGEPATALVAEGLLRVAGDGLEVRHRLIADAIVDQLDKATRRALHARLAITVEEPAERARHLVAAGERAAAFKIAQAALDAPVDPRTRAVLLLLAAETSDGDIAAAYRVRAGGQLATIGNSVDALPLLEAPFDGSDELKAYGASALASTLGNEGRHEEALAVLDGARKFQIVPGGRTSVELVVTEASALVNVGRLPEAIEVVERAVAAGVEAPLRYRLAGHLAALRLYAGQTEELDELEAGVAASLAADDGNASAGRSMDLYYMTLALRGGPAAHAMALAAAGPLAEIGFPTRAVELHAEAMQAAIFAGDLAGSVVVIDTMLEEPLNMLTRQRLLYDRGLALALLGHVDEAERTLAEAHAIATDDFDGRGSVLWCWAEACFWGGQPARARELADASLAFTAFNEAEFVLPSLVRAWAEVELGRPPTPLSVHARFRFLAGADPEMRALDAVARGDHAVAAAAFDEAARLWAGFHLPRELLCRSAAADALHRAGERGVAVARLRAVEAEATAIGFAPLVARVRRSLRLAGERPGNSASARRSGGLLTGREREIIGLVERGLTNAEIARRMALGRPTVARMISNAMAKLGAESRAQAVVLAAQIT